MKIKIEKGVPIVAPKRVSLIKESLDKMEVGDSFEYDNEYRGKVGWHLVGLNKTTDKYFETRKVDDKTRRVWRTQ